MQTLHEMTQLLDALAALIAAITNLITEVRRSP